jgi:hypothetical protein
LSQRPRLAGDGLLRLPGSVTVDPEGALRGRLSDELVDPFEWTPGRILLTESFARLEPGTEALLGWCARHGVLDLADFVGAPSRYLDADAPAGTPDDVAVDRLDDIAAEQRTIAWHLVTLVRLSERRRARDWDPALGQVVLEVADEGDLVVGGPDAGVWPGLRPPELDGPRELTQEQREAIDATERRVRAATADWPLVRIGERGWRRHWLARGSAAMGLPGAPEEKARVLGTTWGLTVALERLLLAPYVERAVERRFAIGSEVQDIAGEEREVLVPREERAWRSVLAPIYLQLFEALRRITEGEPGAAVCRECGRPFLVLDARRRFFCNERERTRFAQRERRRRLGRLRDGSDEEPSQI